MLALAVSLFAASALGEEPASAATGAEAASGVKRDPKGVTGISPLWEKLREGDALLLAGKLVEAEAAYRQAIDLAPKEPMAHYRLGQCLIAAGELDAAAQSYREAILLAASRPALKLQAQGALSDALERQRRIALASEEWAGYRDALAASPELRGFPATAEDRLARIKAILDQQPGYEAVRARIARRVAEADAAAAK